MKAKLHAFIKLNSKIFMLGLISVQAYAASLDAVSFASLPNDKVQIKLTLSESLASEPLNFTIDNPARIALDFQA